MWLTHIVMKWLNTKTPSGYKKETLNGRRAEDGESMILAVRSLLQVSIHLCHWTCAHALAQHEALARASNLGHSRKLTDTLMGVGPPLPLDKPGRSCQEGCGPVRSFGSKAGKKVYTQVATGRVRPKSRDQTAGAKR